MVDVVGELEVLDKVSALSPRFQGCETELFESLCVVEVFQFWDHFSGSSLDSFDGSDVFLQVWTPHAIGIFQMWADKHCVERQLGERALEGTVNGIGFLH